MRRGRQTPTFERVGICDHSDGPDAVALFEGYGVRFIPLSKGGTHTWGNVKLAHHLCNSVKSNDSIDIARERLAAKGWL